MARVQLALNVGNLDEAVEFYTRMFGVGPAKVREGYANFAVENPPLKLVLIEGHGEPGTLNHVGVEMPTPDEVAAKIDEAREKGFPLTVQERTTCCFAVQDKVWIEGGELPWEWYTVLEDAPEDTSLVRIGSKPAAAGLVTIEAGGSCCGAETCC